MADDISEVPGFPLFTDAHGFPINFKLVCDPETKARCKKLIKKYGGEVMKCQGYPRLLLATKNLCVHLHVGCGNHVPYTVAPVFNICWLNDCILTFRVLEIKAYLLNPSPQFALENYMDQMDEGRYRPPPPFNQISEPSRCSYSEIHVPFNGTQELHVQEMQALCSRVLRRSTAQAENLPDTGHTLNASPTSSDGKSQEDSIADCMQRLSSQPSSTPRVPPLTTNNETYARGPGTNLPVSPYAANRSLALPLSKKRSNNATDERSASVPESNSETAPLQPRRTRNDERSASIPESNSEAAQLQHRRTRKERQVPTEESVDPVAAQTSSANQQSSSMSNRLPLSKESSSRQKTEPKKNPRRRELFDSENFTHKFSDDESDTEDMPRIPRPLASSAINLSDLEEDRSPTPSPPHRSLASPPSTSRSSPRVMLFRLRERPGNPIQEDSDNEFGPPPGAVVRVKGVRQNTRAPYSREEELTILKYIKASKRFSGLRSNYIWREMDGKPGLERRTMHSLKEHFLKKMMGNLERYKIFTDLEIRKIRSTSVERKEERKKIIN